MFVRKEGRTDLASDADIDMLSARAATSIEVRPEVGIEVRGQIPVAWFDEDKLADAIKRWVDGWADTMLTEAEEHERRRTAPAGDERRLSRFEAAKHGIDSVAMRAVAASATRSLSALGIPTSDPRTLDDYKSEVERWRERTLAYASEQFGEMYSSQGYGAVEFAVTNRSRRFLTDVEVVVRFPWHRAGASDDSSCPDGMPGFPRPFGEPPEAPAYLGGLLQSMSSFPSFDPMPDVSRRTWVEPGSIDMTFDVGSLRPEETQVSDTIWIRLPAQPDGGKLGGRAHV